MHTHGRNRSMGHPRPAQTPHPSLVCPRPHGDRELFADPPRGDARCPVTGLRPHRAREGPARADRHLHSCAAQRAHPSRHRARRRPRGACRRSAGDRAGLQLARCRAVHVPGGDREGLSDRPGGRDVHEHAPRDRLPAPRPDLRHRRSPDQGGLVAPPAATARVVPAPVLVMPSRSLWDNALWKLRRDKLTIAAFCILIVLAALSLAAPLFSQYVFHYKFEQQDLLHTYEKPTFANPAYLLGSDEIGRSQVVRLLYGGQISLLVGFVAAFVNLTVGVSLGLAAGYFRGPLDDAVTWIITTLNGIPQLYLLLIVAALWTPGPLTLIVIIGLLNWTGISLFVRGQTFALREREFVTAARTIGAKDRRIMFRHILPNVLPLIFVLAAIDVGARSEE